MTGKDLAKLVRSYNASITRAIKKGMLSEQLPTRTTVEEVRHKVHTKQRTLQSMTAELKRIQKSDLTKTVSVGEIKISKTLAKEVERTRKSTNKKLAKKKATAKAIKEKKQEGKNRGKELMEDMKLAELSDIPRPNPKNFKEFAMYKIGMEKKNVTIQGNKYKENFIIALLNNHGSLAFPLIQALESMSGEQVLDAYYGEDLMDIHFAYTAEESIGYIEQMLGMLDNAGYIDREKLGNDEFSDEFINRQTERIESYLARAT